MTHASFFSGKGGFDLAAEWAGWTNVFNCEIDPFCRWQLKYWYPNAKQHTDVNRTEEFEQYEGQVDVLTAGFPCQPFSAAGARQGTDDPRYMWPQTFRGIRAIRPAVFVGENVSGLISWSKGMVFEHVCSDLESEGYTVVPVLLPACGVGAPHKRNRVWFIALHEKRLIAYAHRCADLRETGQNEGTCKEERLQERDEVRQSDKSGDVRGLFADTDSNQRPERWLHENGPEASERYFGPCNTWDFRNPWQNFPTQPPVRYRNDGLSDLLDPDALFAGIEGKRRGSAYVRWCNESLKCDGNAIVPQVAYQIDETINELVKTLRQ